jgi:KDO2-lipid IV(A) lauroyltransferase
VKDNEQNNAEHGSLLKRCGDALTMGALNLLSRCPMRVLYALSDMMYPIVHHVIRYRVRVVRHNLRRSFPEKSTEELRAIERRFYHYFCDLAVEIVKGMTISGEELKQRVKVYGLPEVEATFAEHPFCVCYLGHYCNWEWLTVLPLYLQQGGMTQIYHPMRNKTFDNWFCTNRSRFGAINIPMKQTLRRLVQLKAELAKSDATCRGYLLGCIADQLPKAENIHHYTTFLSQRSAVFTGSEKIGKMMNASFAYARMVRLRRGYYELHFQLMQASQSDGSPSAEASSNAAKSASAGEDFCLTDEFMHLLEQDIRQHPEFWLWTHKRWKR